MSIILNYPAVMEMKKQQARKVKWVKKPGKLCSKSFIITLYQVYIYLCCVVWCLRAVLKPRHTAKYIHEGSV